MAVDLIAKAREGDGDAFRVLTEPHRRELHLHCYRMLGSFKDAEDVLQDTMVAAWQNLGTFRGEASVRTWLYRIATNRCLNARRSVRRRLPKEWDIRGVVPPKPTRLGEVVWLEPIPDAYLAGVEVPLGPEARYEQTESIALAFVRALQLLPPRQLAVLILRDVLGFRAAEVAAMLNATVESVNSALKRARSTMERELHKDDRASAPVPSSASENTLVAKFVNAYESADVDALVALLTDDVFVSMPPMPLEYEGRALAGEFFGLLFGAGRKYKMVRMRANGQPAFASYIYGPDGAYRSTGVFVIELSGDRISAMTRFENSVLPSFDLPTTLTQSS